jgi:hypothetical protein
MTSSDPLFSVSRSALRPELDKALIQTFELERFYNLQEQHMILPIRYRDDWTRRTAAEAPLTFPVVPVSSYEAPSPVDAATPVATPASKPRPVEAQALREPFTPVGDLAGERSSVAGPASHDCASEEPATNQSLPYGADRYSLLALTDAILATGDVVPLIFQYRQAGDLIPLEDKGRTAVVAAQRVAAVYKSF